jgi:putative ABC transport system substrate-binding protein
LVFALCDSVDAQQSAKVYRIGILFPGSISPRMHLVEAFRQGLGELGYLEGHNFALVIRSAEKSPDQLPDLAAELVRLKVDVIVTGGPSPIQAAQQATRTIPLVMAGHPDPVAGGLVAGLARPGGNITGLSITAGLEIYGKRLELLKEIVPKVSRIAFLSNPTNPANALQAKETEVAARALGVQLQALEVRSPSDIDSGIEGAIKARAGALLTLDSPLFNTHRTRIVDLAAKNRLPAMYGFREFVDAGGLMVYGASLPDLWRRAATYVDKILKGAKPADLPVEQPTKFELVINLKAKQIGLTIPQSVLYRADKVIR